MRMRTSDLTIEYLKREPSKELTPYIHFYWELYGNKFGGYWERVFPDGCSGIIMCSGNGCRTDNGDVTIEFGKTYAVGAMNSFKDSFIETDTALIGVCFKPATFPNFYGKGSRELLTNSTIELDKSKSFDLARMLKQPIAYLEQYYGDRLIKPHVRLGTVIADIYETKGKLPVQELAKRHFTTERRLERMFKNDTGLSPKEFSNIIRFQHAMHTLQHPQRGRNLADIAFECGYYDQAHLCNDIKTKTGMPPSYF